MTQNRLLLPTALGHLQVSGKCILPEDERSLLVEAFLRLDHDVLEPLLRKREIHKVARRHPKPPTSPLIPASPDRQNMPLEREVSEVLAERAAYSASVTTNNVSEVHQKGPNTGRPPIYPTPELSDPPSKSPKSRHARSLATSTTNFLSSDPRTIPAKPSVAESLNICPGGPSQSIKSHQLLETVQNLEKRIRGASPADKTLQGAFLASSAASLPSRPLSSGAALPFRPPPAAASLPPRPPPSQPSSYAASLPPRPPPSQPSSYADLAKSEQREKQSPDKQIALPRQSTSNQPLFFREETPLPATVKTEHLSSQILEEVSPLPLNETTEANVFFSEYGRYRKDGSDRQSLSEYCEDADFDDWPRHSLGEVKNKPALQEMNNRKGRKGGEDNRTVRETRAAASIAEPDNNKNAQSTPSETLPGPEVAHSAKVSKKALRPKWADTNKDERHKLAQRQPADAPKQLWDGSFLIDDTSEDEVYQDSGRKASCLPTQEQKVGGKRKRVVAETSDEAEPGEQEEKQEVEGKAESSSSESDARYGSGNSSDDSDVVYVTAKPASTKPTSTKRVSSKASASNRGQRDSINQAETSARKSKGSRTRERRIRKRARERAAASPPSSTQRTDVKTNWKKKRQQGKLSRARPGTSLDQEDHIPPTSPAIVRRIINTAVAESASESDSHGRKLIRTKVSAMLPYSEERESDSEMVQNSHGDEAVSDEDTPLVHLSSGAKPRGSPLSAQKSLTRASDSDPSSLRNDKPTAESIKRSILPVYEGNSLPPILHDWRNLLVAAKMECMADLRKYVKDPTKAKDFVDFLVQVRTYLQS